MSLFTIRIFQDFVMIVTSTRNTESLSWLQVKSGKAMKTRILPETSIDILPDLLVVLSSYTMLEHTR